MRSLPVTPVFSRADARTLGWSDSALTRAVDSGRVLRLRRDQFAVAGADVEVVAAVAASRGCTGSVVSHRSAALLHGLPLVGRHPLVPEVTVPRTGTGDLRAGHLYRARLRPHEVVGIDGTPVTSVARTVVDVARHVPLRTAVAAGDHALNREMTTSEELAEVWQFCRRWPGAKRAARAIRLMDGRAESPLESVSRLTIAWLGLPAPDLQRRIRDERGIVIARTDFYWDDVGVVGEADGRAKTKLDADVVAAWDRHEDLDDLGLQLVRWGWDLATRRPYELRARLDRAFDRGRRRSALGMPRRWSLA